MKSLQSQYAGTNIEKFGAELDNLFDKLLVTPEQDFFTQCYRLDTAEGAGLDRWGQLFGFPRFIKNYIGSDPFYRLDDEQYRKILKIKALQRRGNVTIPELNRYMDYLFQTVKGKAYVKDPQNMTFVTYVFEYVVESWLWFVFNNYDILPHPQGVGTQVLELVLYPFAFEGQAESNFYSVNFIENPITINLNSLTFINQYQGEPITQTVTISNSSDKDITLTLTANNNDAFTVDPSTILLKGLSKAEISITSNATERGSFKGFIQISQPDNEASYINLSATVIMLPQEPNIWLFGKNGVAYRSTDGRMFEPVTDKFGVVTAAGLDNIHSLDGKFYRFKKTPFITGDPIVSNFSDDGKYITASSVISCIDNDNILYKYPFHPYYDNSENVVNVINVLFYISTDCAFYVVGNGELYAMDILGSYPETAGTIKGAIAFISTESPRLSATIIIGNNLEFEGISPNANVFIGYERGTFKEVVTGLKIKGILTVADLSWDNTYHIDSFIVIYSQDTIVITHDFFETVFNFPSEITIDRLYLGRFEDSSTLKVATLIATSNDYFYTAKIIATANDEGGFSATLSPWVKVDINISALELSYITANNGTTYTTEKYK